MNNLYIVATPIGNLQDITLRAANILLESGVIITESTSKAGNLLDFLEKQFKKQRIDGQKILSMTEDEEELKLSSYLSQIEEFGAALIVEAGTPLISDPGFKLVRAAIKKGLNIIPIPGANAAIAAISASGLPTDKFFFLGFLPKSISKKEAIFAKLNEIPFKTSFIIYESPERVIETFLIMLKTLGDIDIVIARELTKIHEEILRDKISEIIVRFQKNNPKGEFVIMF